jgi:hypothetical protein
LIPLGGCRNFNEVILEKRAFFLKGTEYRQTDAAFWIILFGKGRMREGKKRG